MSVHGDEQTPRKPLMNGRFSNRPFGVKRFQTIHFISTPQYRAGSVDFTAGRTL
jgi:hypothetical protein